MDWSAIASLIAEQVDRPLFVLDRELRVRLFSAGMERLLGWPRAEVLGASWLERLAAPGELDATRWALEAARRGTLRHADCATAVRGTAGLVLSLELWPVGAAGDEPAALLAKVLRARPYLAASAATLPGWQYEIALAPGDFGRILRDASGDATTLDRRCHEVIDGRPAPCEGCPLASSRTVGHATTAVVAGQRALRVVTAMAHDPERAYIVSREVSDDVLTQLVRGKLALLAARSGLSERERQVLDLLVLGRSLEDIGVVLGISPRTAKFHQANLLDKLGVESRVDLLRLVL
jgi:PAS domain S-box-containing protein